MKTLNYVKLSLDILMVLVFALLFNTRVFSGLVFHEIAGLALGGVFIIHLVLNGKWIKKVTVNLFSPKISLHIKIGYLVDVLLLLAMGFILVSGVMISKTILLGVFKASNIQVFQSLHIAVSYVSLLLIGIHVGLNWCWVMNRFKLIFKSSEKSKVLGKLGIVVVVLVLCFGSYTIYSENYFSKVSMVQSSVRGTQGARELREGVNRPTKGGGDARGQFLGGINGGRASAGGHNGNGSANVFTVLITHLGIISAFSMMTFYVLKLGNRKKSDISIT